MLIYTDGIPRGLGYLETDDRPAGGTHLEFDTYTCTHCCRVVILNPERNRERFFCRGCNHHICDECAAKRSAGSPCKTWAQWEDELREQERRLSQSGILLP
jgi:hypothetical protein